MMKRIVIALASLALAAGANAAVLKIATVAPEGSDWMREMRDSAREIRERTDGRVQIKYYGGGVMGNDEKVLGKIRIGALHGGAFTPTALASQYPEINLYGLPLVFQSEDEARYVRQRLDSVLEKGLEEAGYVNFGFAAGGFAVLMSNAPIRSLADLKGKRVWVPQGDAISYASMKALSLSPVTLPLTDVLTGLQTGLIDIVAISPIGALVLQWHTKIDYVTELPLVYTLGFMAVQEKAFRRLNEQDQQTVREVMEQTYDEFNDANLAENAKALDALLASGVESIPFDADEAEKIRRIVRQSNEKLARNGEFSLELYEEMMGYVEDYRRKSGTAAAE